MDSDWALPVILLMFAASVVLIALGIAQILRSIRQPGLKGVLYPLQMALGILALVAGAVAPWLPYLIAIITLVIILYLSREDQGHRGLALFSGLATLTMCSVAILGPVSG